MEYVERRVALLKKYKAHISKLKQTLIHFYKPRTTDALLLWYSMQILDRNM